MRDFLNSDKGRYVAIAAGALGGLLFVWVMIGWFQDTPASRSTDRIFIDAKTGQQFGYVITKGETIPVPSPHSGGERVGYEAEPCYWTADGKVKQDPTWVLVKQKVEGSAGPTFCQDCGRLVRALNPIPVPGATPPPTEAEFKPARPAPGRQGEPAAPDAPEDTRETRG